MTKTDTEYFKKLLLQLKEEIQKKWEDTEEDLNSNIKEASGEISSYSFHLADMGTDAMEREKAFWKASMDRELLQAIDHALDKLDNGEYGLCEQCAEPINYQRLEAIPHARLCLECKSKEEINQL